MCGCARALSETRNRQEVPRSFNRWLGNKINDKRAEEALAAVAAATIDLIDTTALLSRMWELRSTITGSDAAYLAAAEAYDCALVTADRQLANAPGIACAVILAIEQP